MNNSKQTYEIIPHSALYIDITFNYILQGLSYFF